MPAVITTHHTADSVKDRVQKSTKTQGLARKPKALHKPEALIPGNPTTENITSRASDTTNASAAQTESATSTGRKILEPSSVIPKNTLGTSNTQQAMPPITGVTATANASIGKATKTDEIPIELYAYMEGEKRRISQNVSNLSLGTAAINGV
ncbi:hypothetical protein K3495_g451 [Podosphaera aphanis]|nr:hypothetical protein K3495_g451 [Podosphaera aphanis]